MSMRDPKQAKQAKQAGIVTTPVLIFVVLAIAAVALDAFDSPNTMAILAVLGAPILGTQILQLAQGQQAAAKLDHISSQVNGELDKRIRDAVTAVLTERETGRDTNIRKIVRDELNSTGVSCRVVLPVEGDGDA